jgi:2-dehydropantoate 2-reductase
MGSLFGGRLAQLGHEVAMLDVSRAVIDAINGRGLIIDDDRGRHVVRMRACLAEELEGTVDLAMLFTKTMYSRAAMESARGLIGAETRVLSLQNGLGNVELIGEFAPLDRILAGVTRMSSDLLAPGHIQSHGHGYTKIAGAAPGAPVDPALEAVVGEMHKAGLQAEIAPDIFAAIWEKAAFNAAINTTSAVCRTPCGPIGSPEGRELSFNIAREAVMVAKAWGIAASEKSVIDNLVAAFTVHHDHVTSMGQDILARRRTEIDAINGQIVKKAKEKGLEVPYTEALYCLVRTIEDSWAA